MKAMFDLGVDAQKACAAEGLPYDVNIFQWLMLAAAGLLTQFGVQAIVNMGVAVNLLPAKGMTLPFLSYGGSSLLAVAFGMGMLLALTRKQFGRAKR